MREDIADAACGDPDRRLSTVAALATRLDTLAERRTARTELDAARTRAQAAEQQLARSQARRPWVVAPGAALVIGLTAALFLYQNASLERNRANRQAAIAAAVNRFLTNDLLGRSNPFQSGKSGETLLEAVKQSSPEIDRQFQAEPEIAARLHLAIAKALDNRSDFAAAGQEYERAAELLTKARGALAPEAVTARLQQAGMEARTYAEGSVAKAREIVAAQEAKIPQLKQKPRDLPVWLASAKGMIALISNDAKQAEQQFQAAYEASKTLPEFDEMAQLTLKQRLAFSNIRLGNGPKAEQLFRELIEDFTRLQGAESPSVMRGRLNLAQAFMIQNKHKDAVAETTSIYPGYAERLGEDHELAMQVLTTRAESEGALGLWEDAIRDDLKIHDLAVKKQGPLSFFAIATQSDAALAMCRAGRVPEGASNGQQAYAASVKAFGPRAGLTGGTAHTLASCWIQSGKLTEASRLLEGIDVNAVAQLAGSKDWGANVDLSRAEIAYRRGDYASTRKLLEGAAPVLTRSDAEPYQRKAFENLKASLASNPAAS